MLYGEQWARGVVIHSGTAPVENTAFWTDQVAGANNYAFRSVGDAKSALGGALTVAGGITHGSATLLTTSIALTNGAAANTGTLTNAPSVGNPTKWIPINDNGTTRHIPAW